MSLEICETTTPEKLKIKDSRFFKDRVQLTIAPDAECRFFKVSDELYFNQKKYYFPLFANLIFLKSSIDNQPKNLPIIFKGTFIKDDEIAQIKLAVKEKDKKESRKYEEYKKILDRDISIIIGNLSSEIADQKKFLKKDYLTKHQYNENINALVRAYADIITIKLGNDINLKNNDRSMINKFYSNMIEGLRNNNISKEIMMDMKDMQIIDEEPGKSPDNVSGMEDSNEGNG